MPELVSHTNLLAVLPPPLQTLLVRIATIAEQHNASLWLVGGVVRDLLLGLPIKRDLDLAVEGDALAVAHALAATGGRVTAAHEAFGTATVVLTGEADAPVQVDLARTRSETYPHPAALPVVQPADIASDLARRDFTINALALPILLREGQLASTAVLDPYAGRRDLAAGVLRVLHDQSFDDDPTRIVRGLRLAARLGLVLESHTHQVLDAALAEGRLEATTPDRVRTELCLALEEPCPEKVLHLADAWGVTPHIFAPLRWSEAGAEACAHVRATTSFNVPPCYAGLLTYALTPPEREQFIARYRLPNESARLLRDVGTIQTLRDKLTNPMRNSTLAHLLQPFGATALAVVAYAEGGPVRDAITRYLSQLRDVQPLLDGHAVQRLGVAPGPELGRVLRELRAARLDGEVTSRSDEEAWVRARLAAKMTG